MPNIQVSAENKGRVIEAHRVWNRDRPRTPGQIGSSIAALIEGPPVYQPGEITTYSDFEPVRFVSVDPEFVDYLREKGIPFQER